MQKMTLLEMTQNILSSMSSDEVNSISDTVESLQVAEEIRTTFYELYGNRDLPEFQGIINLDTLADEDRPNLLRIPSGVVKIRWLKYRNFRSNNDAHYENIEYLNPEEFIERIVARSHSAYTTVVDVPLLATSPVTYPIRADAVPSFYTVFNEEDTLVFDSFDLTNEPYLSASNSLAWGLKTKEFDLEDNFTAPLDAHLFPHFLAEAKSACFINIKEVANSKEEQRARRQLVRSQQHLNKTHGQRQGVFSEIDYSRNR